MLRVCVVGGGTAGSEAAREAALSGAAVTVVERSQSLVPPRRDWPGLVDGTPQSKSGRWRAIPEEVELALGTTAKAVSPGSVATDRLGVVRFDRAIIATGRAPAPPSFPGRTKQGVRVLDNPRAFAELGSRKSSVERAVVSGEGMDALRVAASLGGDGRKVTLLSHAWGARTGNADAVREALAEAALEKGLSLTPRRLERALGFDHLEAVVAGGEVLRCEDLAVVPQYFPDFPAFRPPRGRLGGILVNPHLQSGVSSVYAAGECAEVSALQGCSSLIPGCASPASGRVAGSNSTGCSRAIAPVKAESMCFFGLRLVIAGRTLRESALAGFHPAVTSEKFGSGAACSISFDRSTGQVLGVEALSSPADGSLEGIRLAIACSVGLEGLAFGQWSDSSDISVVTETAREGLKTWRRS
jgi:NADPH-dependent 2,4-dienoyl-CoA reductase/sulfur reductase-like enzyme